MTRAELISDVRKRTRKAIEERGLNYTDTDNVRHVANKVRDAALELRQFVFDGESDDAPDLLISAIAEAMRAAAVELMDERLSEPAPTHVPEPQSIAERRAAGYSEKLG